MTARRTAPLALALALAGCVAAPAEGPSSGPLGGSWGGRGIGLTLEGGQGRLDYDCASGTIDGPIHPDAAGRFSASGTHSPGQGGPEQIDRPAPPAWPARYIGSLRGDTMRLSVELPGRDQTLGPFTLRRGAEPMLLRCL